jgi:hypothetical protein
LPDYRYRNVQAALRDASRVSALDPYESTLYLFLKGDLSPTDKLRPAINSVFRRFKNALHRKIITALFISGCSTNEIQEITGLDKQTIHLFAKLFFDRSIFETKLDLWGYIESEVDDEDLLDFYLHTFRMGPEFVKWNMGSGQINIDHRDMAKDILQESYMKSKSCFVRQSDVATTKQWTGITHQYIRLVDDLDSEVKNPLEDLIFKLRETGESKTVNDFNRDDIV